MAFKKGQSGNPKGRPKKIVEDTDRAILHELYDAAAERLVIANMIATASLPGKQAVAAASWLDERKYGKVKDKVEHEGGFTIRVEYAEPNLDATPAASKSAANTQDSNPL